MTETIKFFSDNWGAITNVAGMLWTAGVTIASLWTAYQARQIKTLKGGKP